VADITPPLRRLTRRDALRLGAASVAGVSALSIATRSSAKPAAVTAAALEPFQAEMLVPPTLEPVRRTATEDVYELAITDGRAEIIPGVLTPVYGYDGIYPGPTIRARKGRKAVVRTTNQLGFHQNVHLHGGFNPPASDGGPMQMIATGDSYTYEYPNEQDAATLWYHDHAHGLSARTMFYGLAGVYVVEDDLEASLDLPRDEFDVPLVIQDRAFNGDGTLRYEENIDAGFMGDTIVVNGRVSPRFAVRRALYRLRLVNASNSRAYTLRLGDGTPMVQIGGDGGLLEAPVPRTTIPIGPAERVDVVVDFRPFKAGAQVVLANAAGSGGTADVMRFDVSGKGTESGRVPAALRPREAVPEPVATRRWELNLSTSGAPRWQMNGLAFDIDRVDARPKLGTTERWLLVNPSHRPHPMHLHGAHFRVIDRSTGAVPPAERGWKDTVMVATGETVVVQPRFAPYAGRYVFHCHNLEHQEKAMMLQMEIVA
jgi:FtsP/CotA-like multicopper oxidase with cupredoxin domain